MSKIKMLPRRSVIRALIGAVLIIAPIVLITLGYQFMGIFFLVPMVAGAFLMKEYFREIGFNS